jgi:transcriptional regulator with XRE-family HTH domain
MQKKKPEAPPKWIASREPKSECDVTKAVNARRCFRRVRECLGLAQPDFARMLDVSLASVQGVESGYRPVTPDLARAVQWRFGVFAASVSGETKEPVTLLGERVSKESVERVTKHGPATLSASELRELGQPIETLSKAAARCGKLLLFGLAYREMVKKLISALNLKEALKSETGPVETRIPRKTLRQEPHLAAMLGIADDPNAPDNEIISIISKPTREPRLFPKTRWLPEWTDFVDENGNVRWANTK